MEIMLEEKIKESVAAYLESGKIESHIKTAMDNAIEKLTDRYGDLTNVIQEQVSSALLPVIERTDYSQYVLKLDAMLTEIVKHKVAGSNQILANFKEIVTVPKKITIEEIFKKYCDYVSENIDTSELEVIFDDGPCYTDATARIKIKEIPYHSWSAHHEVYHIVRCSCEEDDNLEVTFELRGHYMTGKYHVSAVIDDSFSSLANINEFEALLIGLDKEWSEVEMLEFDDVADVEVKAEPEASFS